jgi:hypothetical protein
MGTLLSEALAKVGDPLPVYNFDFLVEGEADWEVSKVRSRRGRLYITRLLTTTSDPRNMSQGFVTVRIYRTVTTDDTTWIDLVYHLGDRVDVEVDLDGSCLDGSYVQVTEVYRIKGLSHMTTSK